MQFSVATFVPVLKVSFPLGFTPWGESTLAKFQARLRNTPQAKPFLYCGKPNKTYVVQVVQTQVSGIYCNPENSPLGWK
jgi:hypothetical protein